MVRFFQRQFGKSHEDAEDATQEILIRTRAQAGSAHPPHAQQRYLQTAARNHVTDEWRSNGKDEALHLVYLDDLSTEQLESPAMACQPNCSCPLERAAQRQLIERLSDAVDELPARQKQAFLLNRIDGLSYEEVACTMGISARMVAKHISRALVYCQIRSQYANLSQMQEAYRNTAHGAQVLDTEVMQLLRPEKEDV